MRIHRAHKFIKDHLLQLGGNSVISLEANYYHL